MQLRAAADVWGKAAGVIDQAQMLPRFDDLHTADPGFFRRGAVGSHRDELPPELHKLFWSRADNRTAMDLLTAFGLR